MNRCWPTSLRSRLPAERCLLVAAPLVALAVGLAVRPLLAAEPEESRSAPCRIEIIDDQNGWPVPLVELRTTHHVRLVSDNAGLIALDQPELMGVESWFSVIGHGYDVAADGFGFRGVRLTPRPGESLTVKVKRRLPAQRLGRITGGGLFAESQKLGEHRDWQEQRIFGCDSVQVAIHRGRMHWAWGDTVLSHYPLGRFHMIGATTAIRPIVTPQPPLKLAYDYFTDDAEIPRNIGEISGSGPTWISGLASLPDDSGQDRLVGTYIKVQPPLTAYEAGLCVWDDTTNRFVRHKVLWTRSEDSPEPPPLPDGHPVRWADDDGQTWLLFGDPFPRLQVAPTFAAWENDSTWTQLEPQPSVASVSGRAVKPQRGSIAWNDYRQRWVSVWTEEGGEGSFLGDLWYAEADRPTGAWGPAVQIVTHDQYTFYNPRIHPEFTDEGSPILLFEGTYTQQFSGNESPTPRYDYNQILYRLDLDDESLRPASGQE